MGIFDFLFGGRTVAAQDYLFPIDGSSCPVGYAMNRFAKLCYAIANAIPEEHRAGMSYRVAVSRAQHTVTMSIDVGTSRQVNLQKVMPGYRLVEAYGWQGNENYLEGTFHYIYFPDEWDGRAIDQCIIETLRGDGRMIGIRNHYDDIVRTGEIFVAFSID